MRPSGYWAPLPFLFKLADRIGARNYGVLINACNIIVAYSYTYVNVSAANFHQ